jgi:hypothetical protein
MLLVINAKPHIADLPFLEPLVGDLEAVVAEIQILESEQEVAREQLTGILHRRLAVEHRGEQVRSRLGAYLRGKFGYTSEQLVQFGMTPRPRVLGRRKPAEPPPASGQP